MEHHDEIKFLSGMVEKERNKAKVFKWLFLLTLFVAIGVVAHLSSMIGDLQDSIESYKKDNYRYTKTVYG